jgi:hypothetical protein
MYYLIGRSALRQTASNSDPFVWQSKRAAHDLEARAPAAEKHIREAAAAPLDDVIRVYERQDIPDSNPTMAPCVLT